VLLLLPPRQVALGLGWTAGQSGLSVWTLERDHKVRTKELRNSGESGSVPAVKTQWLRGLDGVVPRARSWVVKSLRPESGLRSPRVAAY
jgi:hypothetical protein